LHTDLMVRISMHCCGWIEFNLHVITTVPCWLQIKNPVIENKGVHWLSISMCNMHSFWWCKLEATISDPKYINPFLDSDANAPTGILPLTVASLSICTIRNQQENKWEIVCSMAQQYICPFFMF
jgi:DNA polymerase alpha subunit A